MNLGMFVLAIVLYTKHAYVIMQCVECVNSVGVANSLHTEQYFIIILLLPFIYFWVTFT